MPSAQKGIERVESAKTIEKPITKDVKEKVVSTKVGEVGEVNKVEEVAKVLDTKPIATVYVKVWKDKPVEVKFEGKVAGVHIPRIKRKLTRAYLDRKREIRRGK